jgi:peroxiredoxin
MPPLGVEDLNWTMADVSITTKVDVEQFNQSENQYPEPENFDSMTYEQVIQWYRKWHQSPEGKEFIENINQKHKQKAATQRKHFSVPIEHDGSFHMDDIPPGEYQFTVNVYASNERGNRDYRNIRAKLNFDLTIPQYSQTNDEILDLGSLQLIDPKTEVLKIGKRAPALKAQTLSGNNFNLAGCRGKYVLLYLWSPPHLPGETDQKNIPQILKNTLRLCRKNNITCAGMVPNADNDLSRKILNKYIDQYAVKSDQLIITHQQVRQWTGTYTSYEGYYLIDPEGIIIKTGKDLANMPAAITDNIDMLN